MQPFPTRALNMPSALFRPVLNGFIDFDSSVSNLTDSRFVEFLYDWHRLFAGRSLYCLDDGTGFRGELFNAQYHSLAASHFSFFTGVRMHAFFPELNPYFTRGIPLTDEQGRLVTEEQGLFVSMQTREPVFWGSWELPLISASANGPLAWEFVKHMADAFANSRYINGVFNTTIVRAQAQRQMTSILPTLFRREGRVAGTVARGEDGELLGMFFGNYFEDFQEQQQAIDAAFDRIDALADMPFARPSFVPFSLYEEVVNTFLIMPGSMAAAQAMAQELHNRVSLWLME